VFITTLLGPSNSLSDTPTLLRAASAAASVLFFIWLIAPLLARLTRRVRLAIRNATGHSGEERG
jgi:hypothetical protein